MLIVIPKIYINKLVLDYIYNFARKEVESEMENMTFETINKIQVIEKLNDEFTLCKCWVMSHGRNRNMSYISKETVEKSLPSLNYAPVVGFLYKNNKGEYRIAGHECHLDTEEWELIPDTQAFGVVKPNSYSWEIVDEYGTESEYLCTELIMWTGRFKGLLDSVYNEEIYWGQSMEIQVQEYRPWEDDSNYIEILEMSFSALCLLGKYDNPDENVTPCFINARVEPVKFSISEFADQIAELKDRLFAFEDKEGDDNVNENMELDTELTTNEESENTEVTADTNETVEDEVFEVTLETEILETEDFEAKYNDALTEIEQLKAQITELTPYKLAVEKAEREKAENDIFAKYDSRIGDMPEYKTLKEKSEEYDLEQLNKECIMLVGMYAMRDVEEKEEVTNLKFSVETAPKKVSPYGDWFERYANND